MLGGLWKKEIAMMRGGFQISAFIFLLLLFSYLIYLRMDSQRDALFVIDFSAIGFIIMPATLLFSLNTETLQIGQLLFLKRNMYKQMIIKWLHAIFLMVVFYFILYILLIVFLLLNVWTMTWSETSLLLISLFSTVLPIAFSLSLAVYIGWTGHQWLKSKIGFVLSIISTLFILYFIMLSFNFITKQLTFLQSWWLWDVSDEINLSINTFMVNDQISISMILFIFLIYSLVFFLCNMAF
ncbi:hypothetical protein JCM21714_3177 [Gracilibacillus boraciitolerans JCM 21714]|uniref:Uncharacterized protein n=1 Tax=Gracilibacillus boraciitolerans JCM 21714 TaxID=1298598 RepID=W4VLM0_9BACI|nr:hypothetical protein [Gracilibacillus boraciitolerans]GAE94046.1 hypothetical protein JCM21714_3177 [Gracilibacillus boraciitolerans JCM 21714]